MIKLAHLDGNIQEAADKVPDLVLVLLCEELFLRLLHDVQLASSEDVESDRQKTLQASDHDAVRVFIPLRLNTIR
ncbi:hypothetical protein L596_011473 [Steinernema carpocapsae]|uniref:Uncharacterized protein n=1 Tax=Steinernema carpocapsae TaxID=34508 RepID=A0A4U5NTZ7_STECR|nr:hypothetical protein L596_011473 [Steinernema carpocapsae]